MTVNPVPTKQNQAEYHTPCSDDILFFMRRLMKQARKRIRFPRLKQLKTTEIRRKVAVLEVW